MTKSFLDSGPNSHLPSQVQVPIVGEIENFAIRPPSDSGAHKFVYVRDQRPDQALIFRIMDTRIDEGAAKRSCGVARTYTTRHQNSLSIAGI